MAENKNTLTASDLAVAFDENGLRLGENINKDVDVQFGTGHKGEKGGIALPVFYNRDDTAVLAKLATMAQNGCTFEHAGHTFAMRHNKAGEQIMVNGIQQARRYDQFVFLTSKGYASAELALADALSA